MAIIAIVPARGGSKRIPLKNIKEFNGIPMLQRTLEILNLSGIFDFIYVSTDSEAIAKIAKSVSNVKVIERSEDLSKDSANTIDVISQTLTDINSSPEDIICCVYAPNPFLRIDALSVGLTACISEKVGTYITPVTTFPFPVQRSLKHGQDGLLSMANPEFMMTHSQKLEERFHETAQFWWGKFQTWKEKYPMQGSIRGIYTPRWMTQDIDTPEDWIQAEINYRILAESEEYKQYRISAENIIL